MNCKYCNTKLIHNYPKTATSANVNKKYCFCDACDILYTFKTSKISEENLDHIAYKIIYNNVQYHFLCYLEKKEITIHHYVYYDDMTHLPQFLYQGEMNEQLSPTDAPKYIQRILDLKAFL